MNRIDLAGRAAIVTGGAKGIGRAVTERFLASDAAVVIWDHDQGALDTALAEIDAGDRLVHSSGSPDSIMAPMANGGQGAGGVFGFEAGTGATN